MRDEDLKNLPQSIEGWKVREFLEGMGIKHTDTRRLEIGPTSVEIEVYATDEHGRRMREEVDIDVMDLSQEKPDTVKGYGDAKLHRITLPLTQVWEKPHSPVCELSSPHGYLCTKQYEHTGPHSWQIDCPSVQDGMQCERPADHTGSHAHNGDDVLHKW